RIAAALLRRCARTESRARPPADAAARRRAASPDPRAAAAAAGSARAVPRPARRAPSPRARGRAHLARDPRRAARYPAALAIAPGRTGSGPRTRGRRERRTRRAAVQTTPAPRTPPLLPARPAARLKPTSLSRVMRVYMPRHWREAVTAGRRLAVHGLGSRWEEYCAQGLFASVVFSRPSRGPRCAERPGRLRADSLRQSHWRREGSAGVARPRRHRHDRQL